MTKELDEAWITICHYNDEIIHDIGSEYVENPLKKELDIVNNALLRLKKIDNANPSEVLKHFNHFEKWYRKICYRVVTSFELDYDLKTIKQALLKAQEQEKALTIIKEKRVDMWHLIDLLDQTYEMYLAFCKSEGYESDYILTQEEFNLIKEMLK